MSTTIDSLQIEIQTNSVSAKSGIDGLAAALENLKKNGTIGVATKNLNSLSEALRGFKDASNVTRSLGKLSGALERLKSIGSVASIANSIKKLSDNLGTIGNVDIDNVAPQIERVASALAPLSAVKAGGINTMLNGLTKLSKVTAELDDDKIEAFATKVKKLSDILTPLSDKMTSVKAGFQAINTKARSAGNSIKEVGDEVNTTTLNMASLVTVIQGVVAALQPVIHLLADTISQAIEWDGIAARFGRGFGASAQESYDWIQRLNKEMGINVQQFMQYSSVYSTMLTGFGVAVEDATEMAMGYTELTYDIWAGYNDIYKNFADAAEAVKSAIAGEVEPIRRAGFTIVESTLEQTAKNYGLKISLEKATEAQKSYLRYLTLVDQAHAQNLVGTYAKELSTAEGLMRTFSQQVKSLAQAFGSLFLPILVKVMPYLSALVELLTEAVHWLAGLFGFKIQAVDWSGFGEGAGAVGGIADAAADADKKLGNAAKAAKELKNATLGIDELNVISPPSPTGGSGGGGGAAGGAGGFDGLDVKSLWDESIFENVKNQVDEIKEKIKSWLPLIATVGAALALWKIANLLEGLEGATSIIKGLAKGLKVGAISLVVGKLVWDFTGAYLESGNWIEWLKALGTTAIGAGLAWKFGGKAGAAFVVLVSGVAMLGRLAFDLSEGKVDFGDSQTWVTLLTGGIETVVGGVISWKVLKPIVTKAIAQVMSSGAMTTITSTILPAVAGAAPYVAIVAAVVGGIVLAFVDYDFSDIGRTIGEKIGSALRSVGEWFGDVGKAILDGLKAAFKWVKESLDIEDFWDVLVIVLDPGEIWKRIAPDIDELFNNISEWINDKIENLKGNINEFFSGFFDGFFDGLGLDVSWGKEFADIFDIEYLDIVEAVLDPKSLGKHIIIGISKGIDGNAKASAIKDKLSTMWSNAKTWWDSKKPSLKSYTPSIGSIYTPLKDRWDNAREWWNKKKSQLNTYTPSIGSIYEKLSERWKNARDWWNRKKGSMSYTPSIGSIVDKVKSAWNTAKNWWNKNVKLSTKLDIKVPTITVKWKTASAFGKDIKYPSGFSLKFAAAGGIFDTGSLIWAGERGPEVLANAGGGKTGVMNVQQMQDAVYEGVYAAVLAAMGGSQGDSGSQAVNVYLDGKAITASVEKRQRERGASILGRQVYSY